ncbi:inducible alternative oxidase 2 [Ophidiomyces ophidiicola]|nr:glycerol transporter [Ophidiomyces ophidiicola]KAI2344166.1 glycerol transporter [Ophidiomyces ophidiicola]KAI2436186.1 glycerol transporter [Ophidiomyces ophidiicola]KAI2449694.1 inducible alternative oxidase 2 [Ophidiomyces ophidiicola]
MGLLMWLRRLYSLDTLDTRFTASATAPLGAANSNQHAGETRQTQNSTASSKWNTPEFYAYYVVFLLAVPLMFKSAIDVSKESHPSYSKYSARLSTGWIPGRKVDNSDLQYASFRDNIPYMALLLVIHPLLRRVCAYFWPMVSAESSPVAPDKSHSGSGFTSLVAATARFEQRVSFDYWFALLFLVALHGFSAFKVLGILMVNYAMIRRLPRVYIPASTWMFNIGILFANELLHGYKYASITSFVVSLLGLGKESGLVTWGEWLDSWGGLVSRWEVLFNITVLRLISFNLDYYWSLDFRAGSPVEKKQLDPSNLSERDRIATPAKQAYFNVRNYLAYALYSPLYLAGPIVTFNDYVHQQQYRPPSVSRNRTLLYGIRFLLTLLCMELILHYIYVVAISKSSPNWSIYTPFQLSMLGYFNLHIIWLKLLIPWRFFRLWALIDGIDPPENMVRCMSDNYSALAFWRSWHRSFNRWVVRYLYVPLGGSRNEQGQNTLSSKVRGIFNFLVVFTFVALWHDINLRLLMWGWLVTLFVLPEIIASMLFPAHKWRSEPTKYRIICGIGAVGNILMMMAANLVGFALGLDGLRGLLSGILGSYAGVAYLMGACSAVFVAVQVMFEIREGELRAGIRLKC